MCLKLKRVILAGPWLEQMLMQICTGFQVRRQTARRYNDDQLKLFVLTLMAMLKLSFSCPFASGFVTTKPPASLTFMFTAHTIEQKFGFRVSESWLGTLDALNQQPRILGLGFRVPFRNYRR